MKYLISTVLFVIINSNFSAQDLPDFEKVKKDYLKKENDIIAAYTLGMSFPVSKSDSTFYYSELLSKRGAVENSDSAKYLGLILRGRAFFSENKFDSSKFYLNKAIKDLNGKEEFLEYNYSAKNLLGLSLWRSGEIEEAKIEFQNLLSVIEDTGKMDLEIGVCGNLGTLNKLLGDYQAAIKCFERTISLDPTNIFSISNSYLNIGTMYFMLHKFNEADAAYNKAIHVNGIPTQFKISVLSNKANNFNSWGKQDSAANNYIKAIELIKSIPDHPVGVRPYLGLSKIYAGKGNFSEAEKSANEALRISEKLKDRVQTLQSQLTIVKLNFDMGKFAESINLAESTINFANKSRLDNALQDAYKIISMAYDSLGNEPKSLEYLNKHIDYSEKIRNFGRERTKIQMRARYNTGRLEEEIAIGEKKQNISNTMLVISGTGIILLLGLSFVGFRRYISQKKVSQNLLQEKNKQKEILENLVQELSELEKQKPDGGFIFVNNQKIEFKNIIYISSGGHYIYFHLVEESLPIIERKNIKDILELLPTNQFVQIHRSNIVNFRHVKYLTSKDVALSNDKIVKMSRSYKQRLHNLIERNK